ncbi:MAG: cytochrome C [Luteitalea sp.]|nr:cytochrome C [Luteitalea sp.]
MSRAITLALLAVVAAGLVVVSGIISIKASSGHWPLTAWFLDFTKRRSVATHAIGIRVPPLDGTSLILKGAAHYETGCRPCHGSPGTSPPRIPARMTAHPPDLRQQVPRWDPAELFYIVKHGIKFTGMPAWPSAQRDDEVWAVVAFLRALPELDADAYARLVFGGTGQRESIDARPASGETSAVLRLVGDSCQRCHGKDGQGRENAAFPRLAGQRAEYLRLALQAYADGSRHSGTMTPIASGLDTGLVRSVADYYAGLPPPVGSTGGAAVLRGAEIATRGIPAQQVPPCSECHGPSTHDRNPAYPNLTGQFAEYLSLQLRLFAGDRRGGSPYGHIMRKIASGLTAEQIEDVAAHYASLPAGGPSDR